MVTHGCGIIAKSLCNLETCFTLEKSEEGSALRNIATINKQRFFNFSSDEFYQTSSANCPTLVCSMIFIRKRNQMCMSVVSMENSQILIGKNCCCQA